jgi:hypothetical protein
MVGLPDVNPAEKCCCDSCCGKALSFFMFFQEVSTEFAELSLAEWGAGAQSSQASLLAMSPGMSEKIRRIEQGQNMH